MVQVPTGATRKDIDNEKYVTGQTRTQVRYKILKACDFGVAQNRERIIVVATKNCNPFDFNKIPKHKKINKNKYKE